MTWLEVWTRAVVVPAGRRAAAAWVGCGIVGAVLFGPTGIHPRDVTALARHHAGVAAVLAVTWVLVFVPTARVLVRGEGAAYLRALPGPVGAARALAAVALVGLQLPWLALWVIGEGAARGLAVVAAVTLVIVALAAVRAPAPRAGWPAWRSGGAALRAVHRRALRRRAGDALVRGAGLAVLAGAAGGLFVRNNQLAGADAAIVGAAVIAAVSVAGQVGVLLVVLEAHRASAWLAASLGLAPGARVAAVVSAIAAVHAAGALVAAAAAVLVAGADAATAAWLGAVVLAVALGSALGCARVLLGDEASPAVASRVAGGAIAVAAAAVLALGVFGVAGVAAFGAAMVLAIATVPA